MPLVTISAGLQVVLGLFTLIGLIAGSVGYFRATWAKSTIQTLTENNSALEEARDLCRAENDELRRRVALLEERNNELQTENDSFRKVLTGTEVFEHLTAALSEASLRHHQEHTDIMDLIRKLRA